MKPPSDVRVPSVIDPSPSLLPLLLDAPEISSSFFVDRGTTKLGRSAEREGGEDFVGVAFVVETDERRRADAEFD